MLVQKWTHEVCDENANRKTPGFHKLTFGQFLFSDDHMGD